jgi:hypothetical protein
MNSLEKRVSAITIEPLIRAQNSRLRSLILISENDEAAPWQLQYAYQRCNELNESVSSLQEAVAA